ncbi:MAG: 4-amino-4-deoxy-L-arabinose transferase-like glycosyltransferase [Vicingaceae bacterium]|jgi:4-amino-4-deoxy-L-arabinose transferase-like glycosyltransferase
MNSFKNRLLTNRKTVISLLILVMAIGFFYNIGENALKAEEPRRATISMEMMFSGDYIHPTLNNWTYYNKPPLFNWVQVAFMKAFNSNAEWVARMPSLLSHILCCLLIYFSFRNYVGERVATLTAFLSLVAIELLFYGSVFSGEIDLFFSLLVFLQIMCLFIFYQKKKWLQMFLLSYFFAALGVLTKGPPSVAFQGLTLIAMAVLYKDIRLLFRWQHFLGAAIFIFVSGSYFYLYSDGGDTVAYLSRLFKEASQRTGVESELSKTLLGIITVPIQLLFLILPASLLIPYLFKRGNFNIIKSNPLLLFSLYFILFNIPLYWITGDFKNRYVYMFFPFLVLFFAYFYENRKLEMAKVTLVMEKVWGIIIIIFAIAALSFAFTPLAELVDNSMVKALVLSACFTTLAIYYYRVKTHRILLLLMAIGILRIGFNVIYPPLLKQKSRHNVKLEMSKILALTEDKNIQFVGLTDVILSSASIGPLKFPEKQLKIARHMSFEIPYYYSLSRNEPLKFTTEIVPGQLYLAYESFLEGKGYSPIYRFIDTKKKTVVLFEG